MIGIFHHKVSLKNSVGSIETLKYTRKPIMDNMTSKNLPSSDERCFVDSVLKINSRNYIQDTSSLSCDRSLFNQLMMAQFFKNKIENAVEN